MQIEVKIDSSVCTLWNGSVRVYNGDRYVSDHF